MPRLFLSSSLALAAAALILYGVRTAQAQPVPTVPVPATPSPAAAAPQENKYPELQEAFDLLFRKRDMKGAIEKLKTAAQTHPELPSARVLMYQILKSREVNQPTAAALQLELAIHETPSDPEPWIILGSLALEQRRIAEATDDFNNAQKLMASYTNPKRKDVLQQLTLSGVAQVAEVDEKWSEAEARLREVLKLAPEDLGIHQRLAHALFLENKTEDSYKVLRDAKEIDKKNAQKPNGREVFLTPEAIVAKYYEEVEGSKADSTGHAETWYGYALKKAPKDLATRQVVCLWALQKGKLAFAKEQADAALDIEKNDPKLSNSIAGNMLSGLVALWDKKWPEAEKYFQQVVITDPSNLGAKNNLALALVEQEDPTKKAKALAYADENYRANNGANNNNADVLSTLGWVYFRCNHMDQAGMALDGAIKALGGNVLANPDTATYVAHVLYHKDQKYQAKQILENVLKNERPFSMKKEAQALYEKVKDTPAPASASGGTASTEPKK